MSHPRRAPFSTYSDILCFKLSTLSRGERSSHTKSGQKGANRSCSSSLKAFHLSRRVQAASGERLAPFGSVKPALESKHNPRPSWSDQLASRWFNWLLRHPVLLPVGDMTINSPDAVSSS